MHCSQQSSDCIYIYILMVVCVMVVQRSSRHSHSYHSSLRRHRRHEREAEKPTKKQQSVGKVKIYDIEPIIGVNKHLAQHYMWVDNTFFSSWNGGRGGGWERRSQQRSSSRWARSRSTTSSPSSSTWRSTTCGVFGSPLQPYTLSFSSWKGVGGGGA